MKRLSKIRWTGILLMAVLLLLALCAGTVRVVDPFFHYRDPDPEAEVWMDQRGQTAGLLRSQRYETVLMGSSLVANYRSFWFDVFYETSTVKVTFPNGGFREFTTALDYACSRQPVKRVIFGMDPNLLSRAPSEEPDQLPEYLYDDNPWNDGPYLLNKDTLSRAVYSVLKKRQGEAAALQDAFIWDGNTIFGPLAALKWYERPEPVETVLPADAYRENYMVHLREVTGWIENHPEVEFIIFFPPYSILFWDRADRLGETEAVLHMLDEVTEALIGYENVELQFFMADQEVITNLHAYADHIHASGHVTYPMAKAMPTGKYALTKENRREVLDGLREFVVNYDYESIFTRDWNAP